MTNNPHRNVSRSEMSLQTVSKDTSTILFWTNFFDDSKWTLANDTIHIQCPVANCIFTNQRDYLNSIDMYDAIVFHTARRFAMFNGIPTARSAQQLYVFAALESPPHTEHNFRNEADFYNLTLSYRLDSDVIWSYANVLDKETNAVVAPSMNPYWRSANYTEIENDVDMLNVINGKKKFIAWFVSNCKSPSKRENLVYEMKKYVAIDVYSGCGEYRLVQHSYLQISMNTSWQPKQCFTGCFLILLSVFLHLFLFCFVKYFV